MSDIKDMNFEEAIERLEDISTRLSGENVSLDEAISLYEQGLEYYAVCKDKLEDANRRIQVIDKSIDAEE